MIIPINEGISNKIPHESELITEAEKNQLS